MSISLITYFLTSVCGVSQADCIKSISCNTFPNKYIECKIVSKDEKHYTFVQVLSKENQ